MDRIFVRSNSVSLKNDEVGVRYFFDNTDQLCDIMFICLNSKPYYKIYFNKIVEQTEDNPYGCEDLDTYYNPNGDDALRLMTDEAYIKLVRSFLNDFGYTIKTEAKKLTLK